MTGELWKEALATIGGWAALALLVAGGVWWAIQQFGTKWLDNRFAEKLKEVDRQHDVMVRQLQSTIDREFDRAVRLHAKEFDVLAEGWKLVEHAVSYARSIAGPVQSMPDFTLMSPTQAADFVKTCELVEWQKTELAALATAQQRNDYYWAARKWIRLSGCRDARIKMIKHVEHNAVFIRPEVKQKFDELHQLLVGVEVEFEMNMPTKGRDERYVHTRYLALEERGLEALGELEKMIRDRLWHPAVPEALPSP